MGLHHLLDIPSLQSDQINTLFSQTQAILSGQYTPDCRGTIMANLFFEPSTRTQNAFTIAASRNQCLALNPDLKQSALLKGESLLDTIHTFEAMGVTLFTIRHSRNHTPEFVANEIKANTSIINAGDGNHAHPTQCLQDLYTIAQHKPDFSALRVAIVGDIVHSRVANSFIAGLKTMGVRDIRLIGPKSLLPQTNDEHLSTHNQLETGLAEADVIMALRIQKERMSEEVIGDTDAIYDPFRLTTTHMKLADPTALVMHPGPINRGVEIESAVADGPQSVIQAQIKHGIAMKMALIDMLVHNQKKRG
jgi:aspartate carbamoyltransferase catalytic subunit